nr:AlpA family phage regulatory protein [Citrobacter rodentium]
MPNRPVNDPTFPGPVQPGQKSVGWRENDLNNGTERMSEAVT